MDITTIRGIMTLLVLAVIAISVWSWFTKGQRWNASKTRRASLAMGVGSALSLIANHQDGMLFWSAVVIGMTALVVAGVLFVSMRTSSSSQST